MKHTIVCQKDFFDHEYTERFQPELPEVGEKYLVWTSSYVGPNRDRDGSDRIGFSDDPRMIQDGFPGNSNPEIRRFHGWRGTTDENSVHARGVHICKSVTRVEFKKTVRYHIDFGPDLVKNFD